MVVSNCTGRPILAIISISLANNVRQRRYVRIRRKKRRREAFTDIFAAAVSGSSSDVTWKDEDYARGKQHLEVNTVNLEKVLVFETRSFLDRRLRLRLWSLRPPKFPWIEFARAIGRHALFSIQELRVIIYTSIKE